jgi:uncharacterized membrane protein YfcA
VERELLLFGGGTLAGLLGALLGIGGGVLIVPMLTLGFGEPLSRSIGASLVAVVATSSGAGAHNVRRRRADVRLGLTLEIGSVVGAAAGGLLAGLLADRVLAGLFAGLMAYVGLTLLRRALVPEDRAEAATSVDAMAPDGPQAPAYRTRRLPLALAGWVGAGLVSSVLGVGGGIVKVPVMRLVMGVPLHVAAATSNFVLGVTAAAGAYAYLFRGDIDPIVAAPLALGALAGSIVGARIAPRVEARWLAILFVVLAAWVAVQMGLRAAGVSG